MSYFASLLADAGIRHILALNPAAGQALVVPYSCFAQRWPVDAD